MLFRSNKKVAGEEENEDSECEHEKGRDPGELVASSLRHATSRSLDGLMVLFGQAYIRRGLLWAGMCPANNEGPAANGWPLSNEINLWIGAEEGT